MQFWDLSLPLNAPSGSAKPSSSFFGGIMDRFTSSSSSSGTVRLEDCFRYFTTPETLAGNDMPYCSRCKTHRESTKKMELYRFPEVQFFIEISRIVVCTCG